MCSREILAYGEGHRVVGTQHPLAVGQKLLIQRDRLAQPPRRRISVREIES